MKRKTISIILALALCMSLAIPAFATEPTTHELSHNFAPGIPFMSITNVTNIERGRYTLPEMWWTDDTPVEDDYTVIHATAPATATVLPNGWGIFYNVISVGNQFNAANDFTTGSQIPLSNGVVPDPSTGELPAGSTYVLNEGIYYLQAYAGGTERFFLIVGNANASPATTPPASDEIKVLVNGTAVVFDQPPIIENGRTLVPLRAIFEALGADVDWEQATQTVTAVRGDIVIRMWIGGEYFLKNNLRIDLDVPAKIVNGRTLVPARAVAESFGADVKWDGATRTVTITE